MSEPLVYFFLIEPAGAYIKFPARLSVVIAPTPADAFTRVQLDHQEHGLIMPFDPIPLSAFQKHIGIASVPIATEPLPTLSPEERKQAFFSHLRLAADEYLTEEDAAAIKTILARMSPSP
ncbi:MAG: hypothetical protein QME66_05410 [Candidatus Eisenbacteria bacterium]|nr:hypothetical protein [Candidatus Eisenbacteria bacterium]